MSRSLDAWNSATVDAANRGKLTAEEMSLLQKLQGLVEAGRVRPIQNRKGDYEIPKDMDGN
jgi:hypothetical protein